VGIPGRVERPAGVSPARVSTAGAVALTVTLGLAGVAWGVAVVQMNGMAMGVATQLGSFGFFIAVWVAMMAAMMLPGLAPAVVRRARDWSDARTVPVFAVSYLAVWALVGVVVYEVDRPHGTLVAGAVTVAAGLYEFTPVKQHFRRRCRDMSGSGFGFGLCCLGSSIGLMAMLVVLGVMSIPWMVVITVLASAQKFLPPRVAIDVPVALAITGLGILILAAPAAVPGLAPPM
jgi:predicted metal-binding membrane protein